MMSLGGVAISRLFALGGTILGVLFYSMFPEWLILALLIIVLLSTVIFTTRKAWALYKSGT